MSRPAISLVRLSPSRIPVAKGEKPILTTYYHERTPIRVNAGLRVDRAVSRAVGHLESGKYPLADAVEVFDRETGRLHAVIRKGTRETTIIYSRKESEAPHV